MEGMKVIKATLIGCAAYGYIRWLGDTAHGPVESYEYLIALVAFVIWSYAILYFTAVDSSPHREPLDLPIAFAAIAFWLNDHLSWIDPSIKNPGDHSLSVGFVHLCCLSLFGVVFVYAIVQNKMDIGHQFFGACGTFALAFVFTIFVSNGINKNSLLLWSGTLVALPLGLLYIPHELDMFRYKRRKALSDQKVAKEKAREAAAREQQAQRDAEEAKKRQDEERAMVEARRSWELTPDGQAHLAKERLAREELAQITAEKLRVHEERCRLEVAVTDLENLKSGIAVARAELEQSRKATEAKIDQERRAAEAKADQERKRIEAENRELWASLNRERATMEQAIKSKQRDAEKDLERQRAEQHATYKAEKAKIDQRIELEEKAKKETKEYKQDVLRIRDSVEKAFQNMILSARTKLESIEGQIKLIRESNLDSEMIEEEVARFETARVDLLNEISRLQKSLGQLG